MGIPYEPLRWMIIRPMLQFPDTYGGKLATLQYDQRPDRGELNILSHPLIYTPPSFFFVIPSRKSYSRLFSPLPTTVRALHY